MKKEKQGKGGFGVCLQDGDRVPFLLFEKEEKIKEGSEDEDTSHLSDERYCNHSNDPSSKKKRSCSFVR